MSSSTPQNEKLSTPPKHKGSRRGASRVETEEWGGFFVSVRPGPSPVVPSLQKTPIFAVFSALATTLARPPGDLSIRKIQVNIYVV